MTAVTLSPGIHVPIEPPNPTAQRPSVTAQVARERFSGDDSKETHTTLAGRQIHQKAPKEFGKISKDTLSCLKKHSSSNYIKQDGTSVPFNSLEIAEKVVISIELNRRGSEILMTTLTRTQMELCISKATDLKYKNAHSTLTEYLKKNPWVYECCFQTCGCRISLSDCFSADPKAWGGERAAPYLI